MSEKNPIRKNRRVLKQVSLDESRAEPVWPNFSESIRPRDEITKTHSILKTGDSRGLYEMTEIDSPTKTNRRLETMSPKQKKIRLNLAGIVTRGGSSICRGGGADFQNMFENFDDLFLGRPN